MIQLGLIPSYQFSSDPSVNPYGVNPHVQYPPGMNQLTVQPVGPYMTSGDANLGTPMVTRMKTPVGLYGLGIFNTTWWRQRKWLALGVAGILGISAAALATKVLR